MLKIEDPLNFEQHLDKNNNKAYYLSNIRNLANQGNYFSLINFIESSTPNVSLTYFYFTSFLHIVLFYIPKNFILYL